MSPVSLLCRTLQPFPRRLSRSHYARTTPRNRRVTRGRAEEERSHRASRWTTVIPVFSSWNQSVSPFGRQCHVSKVVIEEDLVLPEGGSTRVCNAVFNAFVHFLPVGARLTGECRVLAGGSTVGRWEMFVVQHWNPVHPDHLSPSL